MSQTVAQQLKAFYNRNFFDDDDRPMVSSSMQITFTDEQGESVTLSGVKAMPNHSLSQLFEAFYNYALKHDVENIPVTDEDKEPAATPSKKAQVPIGIEHIEHQNYRYIVSEYPDNVIVVKNVDKDISISDKSPLYKTLLKRYKELQGKG